MANAELLNATLHHIQEHPETWLQPYYRQGDKGCFAYHAARIAGGQLISPQHVISLPGSDTELNRNAGLAYNDAARSLGFEENDTIEIREFARRALALTEDEADDLFHSDNDLDDLTTLVAQHTA
ncbi:hypothetical protein [Streptomyces millisiae]|uniref:DUF4375 domain-containing protein n=1 Tax=Streptomyces millisiae TaxID=3075542 RepID=A0ABU2LLQ6_9ACTN|nr:hypothetical protein [Streptomyces sp. DSM 44918]MDT0318525.1 hypothetical protein [Streptomyces sp. DSM 44918]